MIKAKKKFGPPKSWKYNLSWAKGVHIYLDKVKTDNLVLKSSKNISEKYTTNNYCSDTMTQFWISITTPTKWKLLLLEMNEGERYTAAWLRHHVIHNILKM
jgi:hypothetical protein